MINAVLGGITIPVGAEAILTAVANLRSYPSSTCCGISTPPIAVEAAIAELEIEPNNAFPKTFVWAKDPGIRPTNNIAKSTNFLAIPPWFIMIPEKTKNGMAINEKLLILPTIFCAELNAATSKGITNNNVSIDEKAILIAIGIPTINKKTKTKNKIAPASKAI